MQINQEKTTTVMTFEQNLKEMRRQASLITWEDHFRREQQVQSLEIEAGLRGWRGLQGQSGWRSVEGREQVRGSWCCRAHRFHRLLGKTWTFCSGWKMTGAFEQRNNVLWASEEEFHLLKLGAVEATRIEDRNLLQ